MDTFNDPPGTTRIFYWRVKDVKGRWIKTSFRMIEAEIRVEHPEAERVDYGSMLIRGTCPTCGWQGRSLGNSVYVRAIENMRCPGP